LLQFIRDNNIRVQGHQYQLIQVIEKTLSMALIRSIKIQNPIGSSNGRLSVSILDIEI